MLDVIKDYLISIGMEVDKQAFSKADKVINDTDKKLGKFSKSALGNFAKVTVGATALATAVATAMAKFALSVAEADRQTGLLARRLYTTKENARALSSAMKAMHIGSIEQLREASQDPEMRQQFLELKNLARSLENPKTQQAMKEIRELSFEYQKLMVRFEYFKMEVASKILEIFKKLKPVIQNIIDWFKPIIKATIDVKKDFMGAFPQIVEWLKTIWNNYLKPIYNLIRSVTIFALKSWSMILRAIKETPQAFESAFRIVKVALDPLIKIFRFIEDMIVYLSGGLSYREKSFDKIPWMRKIREEATGVTSENQQKEKDRENIQGAVYIANNTAREQTYGYATKERVARNYKWGDTVKGFQARRVNKAGQVDPKGLTLSEANQFYLQELYTQLGDKSKQFMITSGYEGGHSKGSLHGVGRAMDFGFAGTNLQQQLALVRAVLNSAGTRKALLEVDAQTYNQIYNQLKSEGYDLTKLKYLPTAKSNAHLHAEHMGTQDYLTNYGAKALMSPEQRAVYNVMYNNTYNVTSTDPKEGAEEISRKANEFYQGGVKPL